ncbi:hypothetical protein [Euzebya sp.]|uniref:hypothetical protein n=1 Tax=Euzebya sp. TaxID=1971409 RepID=UPI0035187229
MSEALTVTLNRIARALPRLHEDAYSSMRSPSPAPIDQDDRLTDARAHPHLRPAMNVHSSAPTGDAQAAGVYRHATRVITAAYDQLIPPALLQRPRGGAEADPGPADLGGMLTMLHRVTARWDDQPGSRADDLRPVLRDHARQLERLADRIVGWWEPPARPTPVGPTCTQPHGYEGCRTSPVLAHGMCGPCYHHNRRQKARAS